MSHDRERLIFHGAVVLLVGLLCGFPTMIDEVTGGQLQAWRTAHLGLITTGIWLLAMAAVAPSLALPRREASGLLWSLVGTAYGFMTALVVEALTGVRGHQPAGPVANVIAFAGNTIGALGALLAALLTLSGAWAALKGARGK